MEENSLYLIIVIEKRTEAVNNIVTEILFRFGPLATKNAEQQQLT
jgi:hypothetical protein